METVVYIEFQNSFFSIEIWYVWYQGPGQYRHWSLTALQGTSGLAILLLCATSRKSQVISATLAWLRTYHVSLEDWYVAGNIYIRQSIENKTTFTLGRYTDENPRSSIFSSISVFVHQV
jgi:hypothetical protein